MKNISIFGSTGSIGTQTLEVCRWYPEKFNIVALAGGTNVELLAEQVLEFKPKYVAIASADKVEELREKIGDLEVEILAGDAGILTLASLEEVDLQVAAISGLAGLKPVIAGIEAGQDIAFANKEVLVAAGHIVMAKVREHGVKLLPVDSEHSAIWQCLDAHGAVENLVLTCSGGAMKNATKAEIEVATAAEALNHPTWDMGAKITVDSATLMNKGLEIIEAHWLFDTPYDEIDVVIHPESIIHSMVQYADSYLLAQLGTADMRVPIQFALSYPERWANPLPKLDFAALQKMTFAAPDEDRFPCLALAKKVGRIGGAMPTAMSGANEVLVHGFLADKIKMGQIYQGLVEILAKFENIDEPTLEEIIAVDAWARCEAQNFLASFA